MSKQSLQQQEELSLLGFFCSNFCGPLCTGVGAFSSLFRILRAIVSKASLIKLEPRAETSANSSLYWLAKSLPSSIDTLRFSLASDLLATIILSTFSLAYLGQITVTSQSPATKTSTPQTTTCP